MDSLIKAVLQNYVPTVIALSIIIGIFVIAIAGVVRNSGRKNDVARSNYMIQTVIIGLIMLFISGAFVFAFHKIYISHFYNNIEQNIASKLPSDGSVNNTDLLSADVKSTSITIPDPKCILVVVDTVDCVKKTINDIIGVIIGKMVRGLGVTLVDVLEKFHFNFLFTLPTAVFEANDNNSPDAANQVVSFDSLLKLSEIIGLAWVYLLVVTHYFKSILFAMDNDYASDFAGDISKMLLGFAGVFFARFMAEAIIKTAAAFAGFLFSTPLANGLTMTLKSLITDSLWSSFSVFNVSLVALAIFVLVFIILFGFVVFKNAKRYFILLVMILLAPIFSPMLFFDMTRNMGLIFWNKFIVTSFSLAFDLLILLLVFVFLGSSGLSLGNLILILIGMAVVADSNNLIQQIALASEVSGFKSVVRRGFRTSAGTVMAIKSYLKL
jgi:hypothetical protein